MKHYGDITKLHGAELPIVDIITGGSPCQDLSVAGKREGLAGERSGLFMEQIRLIKEMREHDRNTRPDVDFRLLRPRYMVWENVPGAFSSNKGEDFRAVLEETARIVDKNATIPKPEGGRWTPSGCIMGSGWSIAWRVHDAQFWGVPQRRKRISLIADFGGETAPEILFERTSMSGDLEQSGTPGEGTAESPERNTDSTGARLTGDGRNRTNDSKEWSPNSYTLKIRGGVEIDSKGKKAGKGALIQTELSGTLGVSQDQTLITKCLNSWDVQSKHIQPKDGTAESLYSGECRGGGGESYVMTFEPGASSRVGGHVYEDGVAGTIRANAGDNQQAVVYGISSDGSNAMKSDNPNSGIYIADTTRTLDNNGGNPACNQGGMIVLEGNGSRPSHRGDGYSESESMYTLNATEHHAVCVGNGQTAQTRISDKVGALNCMHDQQAVITYGVDCYDQTQSKEVSKALNSAATDSDHIPCVYGIDRASFNQGQNAQFDFSVEEEKAQTIVAKGPGGTDKTVGALCARDYKGVGNQYVYEGKCIIQRSE